MGGSEPVSAPFPEGVAAAVSLSFDDARASQLDGARILDDHGLRVTFYVLPPGLAAAPERWRSVARSGHEIGNHSSTHPCSANFDFAATNALEAMTPQDVAEDVDAATATIQDLVGVRPRTFAYPCGQSFTGRGRHRRSYVPVIAERFLAGRGYGSEVGNLPETCDLAHLDAYTVDGLDAGELWSLVTAGMARGEWVILAGHDIGDDGPQTVPARELGAFCRRLAGDGRIWVAPVVEVAERVAGAQGAARS
jgi:peptidoglycan/xylan/chitin deacetylase (PgdA/CDA1 family)